MKRSLLLIGSVLLILGLFTACGGGSTSAFPEASDNVVVAEDEYDSHGWKGKIAITFEGEEISAVQYDELNKGGELKSEDEEYATNMESSTGMTPAEAFQKLETRLVEQQDLSAVDAVSGATSSSDRFKALAEEALSQR